MSAQASPQLNGSPALRLSVVVPCHDSESYLAETADSVLRQFGDDCELVLVDDGSSDGTVGLIRRLMELEPGRAITLIEQANAGQAAARNAGIAASRGRYILPLDSDDLVAAGMLTLCAQLLDSQPDIDIVYGDREDFGDVSGIHVSGQLELDRLKYFNQLPYCAMYRRDLWHRIGGYQANVSGFDDWSFWIAAAAAGSRAVHLPQVLLRHRRRRSSQMWSMLSRYEHIYSRIVLNNADAYSVDEVHAAQRHLDGGVASRTAQLSRLLFLGMYYRTYDEAGV